MPIYSFKLNSKFINNLFYGDSVNNQIQINTNDILRIEVVKEDSNEVSTFTMDVKLI